MDVQGVGSGLPPDRAGAMRDLAQQLPASPFRPASVAADSVTSLLRELGGADFASLLAVLDEARTPALSARAGELFDAALAAVAQQNPMRAMEYLQQLAILDPAHAEVMTSDPGLASLRPAIERMVAQLTATAKIRAEGKVAEAARWLETQPPGRSTESRPDVFVVVAHKLIEAGGLANYVRASAVSDILLDDTKWAPAVQPVYDKPSEARGEARIPLRWLLLAWVAMGLSAGLVCWWLQVERAGVVAAIWGGGFLVLGCLGAWRRMR